jgi:RNA polymerase primary sigma factor
MDDEQQRALRAARDRGWITLDEIMHLASDSPVDTDEGTALARLAGLQLVDGEGDPWEQLSTLADEGPDAFRETREGPAHAEDLGASDPATLYLGEISRTPLLTAAQEIQLAKERDAGRAAAARLERGVTDSAERESLEETVRRGEAARRHLIEANLRLVVSVAKKFLNRGLSFLDLIQEGNIGLQKAADKFEWQKGFRFSTYAYWWIRQAVGRAVAEQSRTIRLPAHIFEQLGKLYNAARELQARLGRAPTHAEIGAQLGISDERVADAFRAARIPISLETPLGEDATSTLGDLIADAQAMSPAEEAEEQVLADVLDQALREHLSPRETDIVRLRFGLDRGGEERTLGEVGQKLGISRERVRQLEADALGKLRQATAFKQRFGDYL